MNIQHCLHTIKHSDGLVTFWEAQGNANEITYAELYGDALRLLGGLQRERLKNGEHLLVNVAGLQAYITALWACWLGGIIPVVAGTQGSWCMRNHPGGVVLTDDGNIQGEGVICYGSLNMLVPDMRVQHGSIHPMSDDDTALLLYTSGTTAAPRCVVLSGANLYESGLASSILVRQGVRERYLGWLPLTHIFGLVSSHIVPLFNGFEHCLMHTKRTLTTPGSWLKACAQYKATITCSSPSGLEQAAAHVDKPDKSTLLVDNAGLPTHTDSPTAVDLSTVYVCLCGGESLRESTLRSFEQAVQPFGWSESALCPAYGMSEATMGISYNPPGAPRRIQHIEPDSIQIGGKLVFQQQGGIERISLGVLDDCNAAQIRDQDGCTLPPEHLGIIHIKGSNVCQGYLPPTVPPNPDDLGWLDTGDLGYFKDGWLTVLARQKDMLCYNGVNYIRTELENEARAACGPVMRARDDLALVEAGGSLVLAGKKDAAIDLQKAKRALADRGLPVSLALLNQLPSTGKGTVDRLALEMQLERNDDNTIQLDQSDGQHDGATNLRLNKSQMQLARLWEKRLHLPANELSPDSHFIQLGGDSLALIDLACDIEDSLGVYVDANELAEQPTLQGMCDLLFR